jgi:hypothetical protein
MNIFFEKRMLTSLLIIFLGLEATVHYPKQKVVISIFLLIFFVFALFNILKIRPKEKKSLPIFILPVILLAEAALATDLISSWSLKQVFIILFCGLLYLVLFSLEALKTKIASYVVIINNILTVSVFIGVFLGYVIVYDLYLKGVVVLGLGMMLASVLTTAFFIFFLWHNENLSKKVLPEILIFSLIGAQFFWAVTFLPLLALQSGFILFMIFYMFMDILMFRVSGYISLNKVIRHIIVPLSVLILFLFSIKW